jgi:hypothetical protein
MHRSANRGRVSEEQQTQLLRDALQDLLPKYPHGKSVCSLKYCHMMKLMSFIPQNEMTTIQT